MFQATLSSNLSRDFFFISVSRFLKDSFIFNYVYVSWGYPQNPEALDPLDLSLQRAVSRPTWVLGSKLESSARTVHSLHSEPPLQLPIFLCFFLFFSLQKLFDLLVFHFCGVSSILRSNSFSSNLRISIIKFVCCLVVMVLLWGSLSCSPGWPSSCYVTEDYPKLLFCLYLPSAAATGMRYPFL